MIKYEDEQQQPFGKKTDIRFPSMRFAVRKGPRSHDWASRKKEALDRKRQVYGDSEHRGVLKGRRDFPLKLNEAHH